MFKSMTGFAHKRKSVKKMGEFVINLRSYNNRFLDLNIKTQRGFEEFEQTLFEKISKKIRRGRIDVYFGYTPEKYEGGISDDDILKSNRKLKTLKQKMKFKGEIDMGTVLRYAEKEGGIKTAGGEYKISPTSTCVPGPGTPAPPVVRPDE